MELAKALEAMEALEPRRLDMEPWGLWEPHRNRAMELDGRLRGALGASEASRGPKSDPSLDSKRNPKSDPQNGPKMDLKIDPIRAPLKSLKYCTDNFFGNVGLGFGETFGVALEAESSPSRDFN